MNVKNSYTSERFRTAEDLAVRVDARGLRCPLPVLRLARAMRLQPAGQSFKLLSDDPATAGEITAWAAQAGHRLEISGISFAVVRAAT